MKVQLKGNVNPIIGSPVRVGSAIITLNYDQLGTIV
jgi:hypothetical protein